MALIRVNDKIQIDPAHVTQINITSREVVMASGKQHTLTPAALQELIAFKTKKEGGI